MSTLEIKTGSPNSDDDKKDWDDYYQLFFIWKHNNQTILSAKRGKEKNEREN